MAGTSLGSKINCEGISRLPRRPCTPAGNATGRKIVLPSSSSVCSSNFNPFPTSFLLPQPAQNTSLPITVLSTFIPTHTFTDVVSVRYFVQASFIRRWRSSLDTATSNTSDGKLSPFACSLTLLFRDGGGRLSGV